MSESFNEIIRRIRDAAHASEPYALSCLNVLNEICDGVSPTFMQMFDKMCDMLQDAHDRELEQAYDPQRLRGTKPDTFDGALEALREFRWQHATNDTDAIPYINAVKQAHDRELEEASNPSRECMRQTESEHERKLELLREYGRGRRDGIELADYQRAKVVRRLQAVDLDQCEGSHAMLNAVCCAIYAPENGGWTRGQVCELRDALVDLLGRKTSELEQERDELKKRVKDADSKGDTRKLHNLINVLQYEFSMHAEWRDAYSSYYVTIDPDVLKPIDGFTRDDVYRSSMRDYVSKIERLTNELNELRDRLIELDQSGATSLYKLLKHTLGEAKQIADSLRASKDTRTSLTEDVREKAAEVEALRQECVMYRTMLNDAAKEYKTVSEERDEWFDNYEKAFAEEIDEIDDDVLSDRGLIRLPKDADGEYVHAGDDVRIYGTRRRVTRLELQTSGWTLYTATSKHVMDGEHGEVHRWVSSSDTPDAIARDLLNGSCTRHEAVSRMEKLNG